MDDEKNQRGTCLPSTSWTNSAHCRTSSRLQQGCPKRFGAHCRCTASCIIEIVLERTRTKKKHCGKPRHCGQTKLLETHLGTCPLQLRLDTDICFFIEINVGKVGECVQMHRSHIIRPDSDFEWQFRVDLGRSKCFQDGQHVKEPCFARHT